MTPNIEKTPDIKLSVNQTFGFESDMEVDAFSEKSEYVPEIDKSYKLSLIHGQFNLAAICSICVDLPVP